MTIAEIGLKEFYHQYIVFEADDLTEYVKKNINVTEKDCYMLCSCYVDQDGLLSFNVLSIGQSFDKCTKGLRKKQMLAIFGADFVIDLECKIITPTLEMIKKNKPFIELMEQNTDEDLLETRTDSRLDDVRDMFFPDIVTVGFLGRQSIFELEMKIERFTGPFVEGRLIGVPNDMQGLKENDLIKALPYYFEGSRLICIFAGDKLSKEANKQYRKLMKLGKDAIFGFSKPTIFKS